MIKTKEIEFKGCQLSINYESDGEIVAVYVGDTNFMPIIDRHDLKSIAIIFNRSLNNGNITKNN